MTFLLLLAEGGIIQWEEIHLTETAAWDRRDEWLSGDEDNDAYLYKIVAPSTIYRHQGLRDEAQWYPVTHGGPE